MMHRLLVRIISAFMLPPVRGKAYRASRLKADPYPDMSKTAAVLPLLRDELDTVVLGSSHAHYGFHAEGRTFNLGYTSCDLYHSFELYKWLDANRFDKVKTVILFYDVFSAGFEMEKTSESVRHIPLEVVFGIRPRVPLSGVDGKDLIVMTERIRHHVALARCSPDLSWRGNGDHSIVIDFNLERRVESHVKNCFRKNNQTAYVKKMAEIAVRRGDRFAIVIPPLSSEYRKLLPSKDLIYADLRECLSKRPEIRLIDMQGDDRFGETDFLDYDHLNEAGARKLSRIVLDTIKEGSLDNGR